MVDVPYQSYWVPTVFILFLVCGGAVSVVGADSLAGKAGGVLALLCGVALASVLVLHLRRPVER